VLVGVVEGRSVGGDVVVEGVALERQQHEVTPTWVLGGLYAEDDGHQGPDVLDADRGSLKRASCGAACPGAATGASAGAVAG
jgi:hypothetical protein